MKHATSRVLYAHWDALRGARSAPERGEIEPGEIRHVLADSFLLEVDPPARAARLRVAGTRLCALYGRELKEASFAELWGAAPAADPWQLVETVIEDTAGIVAGLRGRTAESDVLDLEMLLLPLRHRGRTQARVIGTLSAGRAPDWIGLRAMSALETVTLRVLVPGALPREEGEAPGPPPVRRHGFVVHQGGRA